MVKNIKVYTRTTCAPCKMLKSYLTFKGLDYSEVNVDESQSAMEEAYKLTGVSMVPVTVVENEDGSEEVISGYNLSKLASLVNIS